MGHRGDLLTTEEKLLKANRLYAVIGQINHLVIHSKSREDVFSGACHIAVEQGQLRMAWIGLINPETERLVPVAWAGHEDGYLKSMVPVYITDVPGGQGPSGRSIRDGQSVVLNSIDEPNYTLWREEALKRGYGSSIALPIKIDDKVIGAFSLYAGSPNFFNREEVSLLEELVRNISFAIESISKESQRRKNELLLSRSELNFRTIFEKSPIGIAIIDSFNGQIYDLNQRYAAIAGRTMEEMKTLNWMTFTHPDDIQPDLDNMAEMNSGRTSGFKMYKRYIHPDGKVVWIHMSISPFDIAPNGRRRHFCMVEDVTERKMIEEELKVALRIRDEFLMVASHELKTPLTTLQVLLHSTQKTAEKEMPKECSEVIIPRLLKAEKQTERLGQLIKNLLDVSQMSSKRLKVEIKIGVDISKLVTDVVNKVDEDFERENISLKTNIEQNVVGEFDPLRIEQVLTNLLSNAKKYGNKNPIELIFKRCGKKARIEIKDQGIGIPKEKQYLIFERFERAVDEHSYKGLGLGLWIVKQLVETHHGKVWVESKVSEGSTFLVELPLTQPR